MRNLIGLLRVKQWTKNSIVVLAPFSAGKLGFNSTTRDALLALVCFSLASSTGYIVNDWKDRERDALHIMKKSRPIAAGTVGKKYVYFVLIVLVALQILIEFQLDLKFIICINLYLINSISYTIFFKKIAVLEMVAISIGFILRPIGGALATQLHISKWFLLVIGFASLFIVSSKRLAEYKDAIESSKRPVLLTYSTTFLESVSTLSLGLTIVMYSLWAFEFPTNQFLLQLSIFPVLVALLRYLWHRDQGDAQTPEEMLFSDELMPFCGGVALFILAMAFYK
jgi:decaprenyl-phosphate phosphoribosyltransferase